MNNRAGPPRRRALLTASSAATAVTLSGQVTRVIDGDTVHARVRGADDTIRMIGIDTPETREPKTPVQCCGSEASAQTKHLRPAGTEVRLLTDPTQESRDRDGRLLA